MRQNRTASPPGQGLFREPGAVARPGSERTATGPRACLALLAATALLALAAPAQAQTEVWSATLTPQDTGNGALGCDSTESNTAAQCSNTAVLSDNDFTLGSTDHTIGIIELAGESLQITSTGVFTDADTLALVLGTTSLAFSRGVTIQGGAGRVWPSTGLSWTAGTDVSVRLISLTAPTGLAATANGPSRIDLSWTAPVNTGGSAITGYKIEVSPDGSSWSDLDTDTESTDTAYAHMGLDPATTRHYRVSAINAVGTSDASDSDDTTTASTNTAATGAPTITGTAQVGQTLTAVTTGIVDANGLTSPGPTRTSGSGWTARRPTLRPRIRAPTPWSTPTGGEPMRKMILGFAVAIMLMAASAQAQGAVWSATFTPGDVNGYAVGCRNGDDDAECSNPSILSDDEFTVDGVVYTVTEFYQTSGTNRIYFAGIRSAAHAPGPT